ncbi:N-acetyl-gamma-glutamyl-phosphate reductase [gamma proteobacterium HTCC5015]|nr:N-acetyl-gamma-glutamyl-phosphate reductase [gamma proteobacterium HTCC5015]
MTLPVVKAGIVGATGYSGAELLRLLKEHPQAEVTVVTSRSLAGTRLDQEFPSLRGQTDLVFSEPTAEALAACDVVFYATPHGVAMSQAREVLEAGTRIIDLSADFRIQDTQLWSEWYGMEHACPDILKEAVYGLPEMYRDDIRKARVVGNPGCYPTAVTLGLAPLLKAGFVDVDTLIADSKSGASGAGRGAKVGTLFCEVAEDFKAYGATGHRHLPEIAQNLDALAGTETDVTFVPHLLPMVRGIETTLYANLKSEALDADLQALYEQAYCDEPFVDMMPAGSHPSTGMVRGINQCRMALHRQGPKRVIVLSVIDNLIKGASGQAIQNMNLMFGLDETAGLMAGPVWP